MSRFRRADEVTFDIVDGRAMLVDADGKEMLILNSVGTLLWQALDGQHDAPALAELVVGLHPDLSRERARLDVETFLDELSGLGLVV